MMKTSFMKEPQIATVLCGSWMKVLVDLEGLCNATKSLVEIGGVFVAEKSRAEPRIDFI